MNKSRNKKIAKIFGIFLIAFSLLLGLPDVILEILNTDIDSDIEYFDGNQAEESSDEYLASADDTEAESETDTEEDFPPPRQESSESSEKYVSYTYNEPYVSKGKAGFSRSDIQKAKRSFKKFSELDSLGRCGPAIASIGPDSLPKEDRTSIGSVKPTGWHTVRYDDLISDRYLYNRCHLIAFCLSGENANRLNLITGTRYLNVEGMLPIEMRVLDYVKGTKHHVLYRVTPNFKRNELVARGVTIEAKSIEDNQIDIKVYCPNVQPGIEINYATGESRRA